MVLVLAEAQLLAEGPWAHLLVVVNLVGFGGPATCANVAASLVMP